MQTFHDKTGRTHFHENTIRQYVEQHWTIFFVIAFRQISVSCHPIALSGRSRFRKGWFVKYPSALSRGFQQLLLQAIAPDVDKQAQIKGNCFLKTA